MNCPRDNSKLTPHQKGKMSIHLCEECSGFFVSLDQKSAKRLESLLQRSFSKTDKTTKEPKLFSPYSDSAMHQFKYRGIQLDYCKDTHSIWFDRDEYPKVFGTQSKTTLKSANSAPISVLDIVDSVISPLDVLEISASVVEGIGDFVGDLVSGIDVF